MFEVVKNIRSNSMQHAGEGSTLEREKDILFYKYKKRDIATNLFSVFTQKARGLSKCSASSEKQPESTIFTGFWKAQFIMRRMFVCLVRPGGIFADFLLKRTLKNSC